MAAQEVHPSQRRVSCEMCRKHKSKCRRLNAEDLRCTRCMVLGIECTAGLQNKVGRPRRAHASNNQVSKSSPNKSISTVNRASSTPATEEQNHEKSNSGSLEGSPSFHMDDQLDWSSLISSPILATPAKDPSHMALAWPTMGVDLLVQPSMPWDTTNEPQTDPSFSFTVLPPPLDTPISASLPPDRTCLTTVEDREHSWKGCTVEDISVTGDALTKLSKLNLDACVRVTAIETNKAILNFESFVYPYGVLYIDDTTLAEFLLKASQELLRILTQLLNSRSTAGHLQGRQMQGRTSLNPPIQPSAPNDGSHYLPPSPSPSSSSSSDVSQPPLVAPVALTITSIYVQLISLYEWKLEHLTARLERIATEPISPMPRITSGSLPVTEPCIQGILFSEVAVYLLERIERALGIGTAHTDGDRSLLSVRQKDVLWGELGGSPGNFPCPGYMRPTNVREMFKKVKAVLKQIS